MKAKKARGSKRAVTVKIEKIKGSPVKTTQGPAAPDTPPTPKITSHPPRRYATATEMASKQREISVSEFFAKNRHLLGFDNPRKALLTTVKEAVDNALDACEEAGILPEVEVRIDVAKIDGQPTL